MGEFLVPPTFNPPRYGIPLGSNGQVLTMVGTQPRFAAAAGGGGIGSSINFSPAAGTIDPSIAGFTTSVGRIKVTLAGNTTFEGLPVGADGQQLFITIVAGNFFLTLSPLNGATAQKQIRASGAPTYQLNDTAQLFYDVGLGQWVLVS